MIAILTHRRVIITLPDELEVDIRVAAHQHAECHSLSVILNCIQVVLVHLPEAFEGDLFSPNLDPVSIVPESLPELYNKLR